jgi:hypothetical protein
MCTVSHRAGAALFKIEHLSNERSRAWSTAVRRYGQPRYVPCKVSSTAEHQWYGHKQAALAAPNWRPLALPVSNNRRVLSARADVQMMQQIIAVASPPLGIAVHGHIVVGKMGHAGLKGLKLI